MKHKTNSAVRFFLRLILVAITGFLCLMLGTATYLTESTEAGTGGQSFSSGPSQTGPEGTYAPGSTEPEKALEPEFFTLSFVGDITPASTEYNKALSNSYESVVGGNLAFPFEKTAYLFNEDDFTFANFECVLSNSENRSDKNFCFKADSSYTGILTSGSVEFVTLGNNHVLDYGDEGYADTKAALEAAGIGYAGRDEWSIHETAGGLKIGVYAVSFGKTADIKAGISKVRAEGADFVIAALHWGDEGSYDVNKLQREQGRAAIDAGADFVYGSHPHVLQEYEEYAGKYIYYSFGNWSFGGNTSPRDPDTIVLKLTLMRDTDGTVSVYERQHIPCSITGIPGGNNYQPYPYEEGGEEYLRALSKIDGSFEGQNLSIGYEYNFSEY